jgi:hypothetical protein
MAYRQAPGKTGGLRLQYLSGQAVAAAETVVDANGDGYTVINPASSPVPVPPILRLLAPGLLGLIGLRRRKVW